MKASLPVLRGQELVRTVKTVLRGSFSCAIGRPFSSTQNFPGAPNRGPTSMKQQCSPGKARKVIQFRGRKTRPRRDREVASTRAVIAHAEPGSGSSVIVRVRTGDSTHLEALIDRSAPRKKIINDLREQLRQFAVPYRERLDQRVLEGLRLYQEEGLTFDQASISVFGDPKSARTLRYWRNMWGLQ
jgi:hypothetical protein